MSKGQKITRRDFLKATGVSAGALAGLGALGAGFRELSAAEAAKQQQEG